MEVSRESERELMRLSRRESVRAQERDREGRTSGAGGEEEREGKQEIENKKEKSVELSFVKRAGCRGRVDYGLWFG
jgi:hypothetical protein